MSLASLTTHLQSRTQQMTRFKSWKNTYDAVSSTPSSAKKCEIVGVLRHSVGGSVEALETMRRRKNLSVGLDCQIANLPPQQPEASMMQTVLNLVHQNQFGAWP